MNTSPLTPPASASVLAAADVINSATPLETTLLGRHPRMLADQAGFDRLRARLGLAPWSGWLQSLIQQGERLLTVELPERLMGVSTMDVRHFGEQLIHLALLFRMTGEARYRDRTAWLMDRLAGEPDWGHSLVYGHWARGFAFALDWLWDDWDPAARSRHVETLYRRTRNVFDAWASFRSGEPFGYTWNISAVVLGGVAAAAACLYGERPDIAPLANLAWEKMRGQSAALGPDGVSPEGIMYGGYYTSYLAISFLLAEAMFGFDLFETTPWLGRYARALHAQTIPRTVWRSDDLFFHQGDAHGHAFGHEGLLRILAARLKDGAAAWFADAILESGAIGTGPFSFLLHDPEVRPETPAAGVPFAHLEDFGIVVMRENWSGTESACAMKCGPNVGHHAAKRYSHPLGGGHMHPNNGELQIFSHGEWILRHPGYVFKETAFHNTLLVDGEGQIGEHSEWFEDLPYRLRRRHPFMARAEHHGAWDLAVADLTNAYPPERGLTRLRRHLVYIRPDTWLLFDAVESARPVLPEALFHTGFPLKAEGANAWSGRGEKAGCRVRALAPTEIRTSLEDQPIRHTSGKPQGTLPLLRVAPRAADVRHLLVTEIRTWSAGERPADDLAVILSANKQTARMTASGVDLTLRPFDKD
jgi:hypothetical protein